MWYIILKNKLWLCDSYFNYMPSEHSVTEESDCKFKCHSVQVNTVNAMFDYFYYPTETYFQKGNKYISVSTKIIFIIATTTVIKESRKSGAMGEKVGFVHCLSL